MSDVTPHYPTDVSPGPPTENEVPTQVEVDNTWKFPPAEADK